MPPITKLISLFLLSALLIGPGVVVAQEKYKTIKPAQPTQSGDKIEVLEIFWYGCPHCYSFEPHLVDWKKNLAEDVHFRRMPAVLNKNWVPHARAFYAAEKMGVLDKIHLPLFKALHTDRKRIYSKDELIDFVGELGIDKKEFAKNYASNETDIKMKEAYLMAQRARITGVPAVIVNGKYLTSASSSGSFENMLKIIDDLVATERQQP